MPIKDYGILKGKAYDRIKATAHSEHFQILINRGNKPHRIAINSKSSQAPSQVLFYSNDDFHHEITDAIAAAGLADGFTPLKSNKETLALDFIRRNLFDIEGMKPIPSNLPGDDNDLNDKLDFFVQQAISDADAVVYAFGQHWVDNNKPDQYFAEINPSTGIHDIHMNQGNPAQPAKYYKDNGVYQDGGLIFHYPSRNRWAAVFTAFQSQSFHTDDQTGHPLNDLVITDTQQPEFSTPVRIIAAMVNPMGEDPGGEYVILLNKSSAAIDLSGWQILDKMKQSDTLGNISIAPGSTLRVPLSGAGAQLSNKGGNISLVNKGGLKVDGVSYTAADASRQGELIEL